MTTPVIGVFGGGGIKGIALAGAAVAISVAREPLDFDLTPAEARAMFDHGFDTALRYMDRHPVGV